MSRVLIQWIDTALCLVREAPAAFPAHLVEVRLGHEGLEERVGVADREDTESMVISQQRSTVDASGFPTAVQRLDAASRKNQAAPHLKAESEAPEVWKPSPQFAPRLPWPQPSMKKRALLLTG